MRTSATKATAQAIVVLLVVVLRWQSQHDRRAPWSGSTRDNVRVAPLADRRTGRIATRHTMARPPGSGGRAILVYAPENGRAGHRAPLAEVVIAGIFGHVTPAAVVPDRHRPYP